MLTGAPSASSASPNAPLVRCEKAITKGTSTFLATGLRQLAACTADTLDCLGEHPSEGPCLTDVRKACTVKLAAARANAITDLRREILDFCSSGKDAPSFDALLASDKLNFQAANTRCGDAFGADLTNAASLAQCIAEESTEQLANLLTAQQPRSRELLALLDDGVDALNPNNEILGATCEDNKTSCGRCTSSSFSPCAKRSDCPRGEQCFGAKCARPCVKIDDCGTGLCSPASCSNDAGVACAYTCTDDSLRPCLTSSDCDPADSCNTSATSGTCADSATEIVTCALSNANSRCSATGQGAAAGHSFGICVAPAPPCNLPTTGGCDCRFGDAPGCVECADSQGSCEGCGTPPDDATISDCSKVIAKSGAKYASTIVKRLGQCSTKLLACELTSKNAAKCRSTVKPICTGAFADVAKARDAADTAITSACSEQKVSYATLRSPRGDNIDGLFDECSELGNSIGTLQGYVACILAQHGCRAATAIATSSPRTETLLSGIQLDLDSLLCPSAQHTPAISANFGFFAAVNHYAQFAIRPFYSRAGVSVGTKPPGFTHTVSVRSNTPNYQRGGSTRFVYSFKNAFGGLSSRQAVPDTQLLLQVRRSDGALVDGFFETAVAPTDTDEEFVVTFPPELRTCSFNLEFGTVTDGQVSAFEPLRQHRIPDRAIPKSGGLEFVELLRNGVQGRCIGGVNDDAECIDDSDCLNGTCDKIRNIECSRSIAVSKDGKSVYLTSLGRDPENCPDLDASTGDALAVFRRDPADGRLLFLQSFKEGVDGATGLDEPREVAVSPDDANVYVASGNDNAIAVFSRDKSTGELTFVSGQHAPSTCVGSCMKEPFSIDFSPTGDFAYVAAGDSSTVVVFQRDVATGALTFVEAQQDGVNGAHGFAAARAVRLSSDGKNVYVVGFVGGPNLQGGVAVFSRDAGTGKLTFTGAVENGVDGITTLFHPFSVAVSPDAQNVYTVSSGQDALNVFERDTQTGGLSFIEAEKDPSKGSEIGRPTFVVVSPDGERVYVAGGAGKAEDVVVAYTRDAANHGALTLAAGGGGVSTISGIRSVAVDQSSLSVYVTGQKEDAIGVFRAVPGM